MCLKKQWTLVAACLVFCLLAGCLYVSLQLPFSSVSSPDCTEDLGLVFQESDEGLTILAVARSSNAGKSGLQPGDTVLAVNHVPVRSLTELDELIHDQMFQGSGKMDFLLLRSDHPVELSLSVP